jgi:peptide/nickel transport system substrate-binding protein
MTAEDVKFSYERMADPAQQSEYADDMAQLDHVEVTDKYSGVIVLKEPFAPLWTSSLPGHGLHRQPEGGRAGGRQLHDRAAGHRRTL